MNENVNIARPAETPAKPGNTASPPAARKTSETRETTPAPPSDHPHKGRFLDVIA
jgi:hypothetical protein